MPLEDKFWTEQTAYLWVLQSMFPLAYLSLWLLNILNTDTSILLADFLRGEYVNLPIFDTSAFPRKSSQVKPWPG